MWKFGEKNLNEHFECFQKEDGSFVGDKWGEVDTRFSFGAVAALALLDRLVIVNILTKEYLHYVRIFLITLKYAISK